MGTERKATKPRTESSMSMSDDRYSSFPERHGAFSPRGQFRHLFQIPCVLPYLVLFTRHWLVYSALLAKHIRNHTFPNIREQIFSNTCTNKHTQTHTDNLSCLQDVVGQFWPKIVRVAKQWLVCLEAHATKGSHDWHGLDDNLRLNSLKN